MYSKHISTINLIHNNSAFIWKKRVVKDTYEPYVSADRCVKSAHHINIQLSYSEGYWRVDFLFEAFDILFHKQPVLGAAGINGKIDKGIIHSKRCFTPLSKTATRERNFDKNNYIMFSL